ncbi:hypothetical protein GUJ93_ZPchr0008g12260 [Zizania palustris]|uniref:Protein DEFECTIVE IN MERISTEM SILENCING 3 n=1 Tax=Zizania palustris TaxID=103762 RepID=A0A8J5R9Z6_ZIZPA|nr:hypothetical protein GUJ93_ZPchr0008g12260 [Zizania palustris]
MESPLTLQIFDFNIKVMQDELQKLGLKVNHYEENIRFLKSKLNAIEELCADMGIKIANYYSSMAPITNNDTSVEEAEQRSIQSILNQDKTAAGIICQLKVRHYQQVSKMSLMKDVLGIVASMGKVNDDNLSRILSEFLGLDNMLGVVCKTYDGVKSLDWKISGWKVHCLCLENIRPFSGDFMVNDPQRKLVLHKPRLPNGECPPGFLGFAVNMIHLDLTNLSCLTAGGHGLRETLFYCLFSHLQVYKTRAELRDAIPLINDGAVSLDGGILRPNGSFCLGNRTSLGVKFPVTANLGVSNLPDTITELEEQFKHKNWEKERLLEDMKRQEDLLSQVKDLFNKKKKQITDYLFQPTMRVQGSPTVRSPATMGSNPFQARPPHMR